MKTKTFDESLVHFADALLVTINEDDLDIDEVKATLKAWIEFGLEVKE